MTAGDHHFPCPMLVLLGYALNPLIGSWPMPLRMLISLSNGIPLMTWHIMPALSRLFFNWLYPEPKRDPDRAGPRGDEA